MNKNELLTPDIIDEITQGRKINAIKMLREKGAGDLKDCKEIVDNYCLENNIEYHSDSPSVSFTTLIVIAIFIGLSIYFANKYF